VAGIDRLGVSAKIQAGRNENQAGRNKNQARRNKIQIGRNKIKIDNPFSSMA